MKQIKLYWGGEVHVWDIGDIEEALELQEIPKQNGYEVIKSFLILESEIEKLLAAHFIRQEGSLRTQFHQLILATPNFGALRKIQVLRAVTDDLPGLDQELQGRVLSSLDEARLWRNKFTHGHYSTFGEHVLLEYKSRSSELTDETWNTIQKLFEELYHSFQEFRDQILKSLAAQMDDNATEAASN